MQFVPLLGKSLKDDEVIALLEDMEMQVIYEFDRLHEGQPDTYSAASHSAGVELRFDAAQRLRTIFLYITPTDRFAAFVAADCDVSLFSTFAEAQGFGEARSLALRTGDAGFLGIHRHWVLIGFGTYSIHYEFREGCLALVTISRNERGTV